MPKPIEALIDAAWSEKNGRWEAVVDLTIGHTCTCGYCERTGLSIQGVISTGDTQQEAFSLACSKLQNFLSDIQGVPMGIITEPGDAVVTFEADEIEDEIEDDIEYVDDDDDL